MNREHTAGIAVQDVSAPVEVVLRHIAETQAYVGKVPGLREVEIYASERRRDGCEEVKARLVLGLVLGYSLQYYSHHLYNPRERCLTWTLDYARKSDLHDSVGYWRVDPLPGDPSRSRVYYSTSSLVRGLPRVVMDAVTGRALHTSVGWVKLHSEQSQQMHHHRRPLATAGDGDAPEAGERLRVPAALLRRASGAMDSGQPRDGSPPPWTTTSLTRTRGPVRRVLHDALGACAHVTRALSPLWRRLVAGCSAFWRIVARRGR
mmetsp:Transcript_5406/g.15817  ORF Transcript_5406/g.15817 Transcript_5406/m.15817 type:complete len:262 (+) Transcript_5406:160-945(+)